MRKGLGFNVSANAASTVIGGVLALVVAPIIIHFVGLRVFGFWSVVSALTQYSGVIDFGVGAALFRHVAVYDGVSDQNSVSRFGAAALWISGPMAVLVLLIGGLSIVLLAHGASASFPDGWEVALAGAVIGLACTVLASTFQAFPRGLGRWDLAAIPNLTYQTTFALLATLLLVCGTGLPGLGVATAAAGLGMLLVAVAVKRRVWRQTIRRRAPREDVVYLAKFGGNLQLSTITTVINSQADKPILLAIGAPLEFVGLYELASKAVFQVRTLPISALGPLTATLASTIGEAAPPLRRAAYEKSRQRIARWGVLPLVGVYGALAPLMIAWLGTSFQTASAIAVVLSIGYVANFATSAGTTLANAAGRPDFERNYCLLSLAANIVLSAGLGVLFGPWGVVAATSTSMVLGAGVLFWQIERWLPPRQIKRDDRSIHADAIGSLLIGGVTAATAFWLDLSRAEALIVGAGGVMSTMVWTGHRLGWFRKRPSARFAQDV